MDLFTLAVLLGLITGGIALDSYIHPRTLIVQIIPSGDNSLNKDFVANVVNYEINRMTAVRSLVARPYIDPSGDKGFVGALGEATGTSAFLNVIGMVFQDTPNALNVAVYNEGGKLKVFVSGLAADLTRGNGLFNMTVTQTDGETQVDTIERATVLGAAHIDPYLATMYLLTTMERTGEDRYGTTAIGIVELVRSQIPADAESPLLARLQNLEGLVQMRRGKLDLASAAFASGLTRIPPGYGGPTPVLLELNKAFVDVARNDTDGAAALLAEVTASTDNFEKLVGAGYLSSEGAAYNLTQDEVDDLRAVHETVSAYVALRRNNIDEAEAIAKNELSADPHRLNAISLLADIEGMRGNQVAERALRKSAVKQSLGVNPFLEIALFHAKLSFTAGGVELKPGEYILW
jgi:hypothetical protein